MGKIHRSSRGLGLMPIDTHLTTKELAERWSMSPGTLDNWRTQTPPRGPSSVKKGWAVFYPLVEVIAYEKRFPSLLQRRSKAH